MKDGMKLAAIDTGSNAVRMAISDFTNCSQGVVLKVIRIPIRLGHDVFSRGSISDSTATRLIQAFQKFKAKMADYKVCNYKAVATSAMREARNGEDLRDRIFQSSQVQVEIIDGKEEARLVHLGVKQQMGDRGLDSMIFDIGGGSVETIFSRNGIVTDRHSMRMGTVRLLNQFDPDHEFEKMHTVVRKAIEKHHKMFCKLGHVTPKKLIATGGNVCCLGRLSKLYLGNNTDQKLKLKDIESLITLLHSHNTKTRQDDLGLRPDRADVIMPAILLVHEFMFQYGYKSLYISYFGLKDGVLFDLAKGCFNSF